MMPLVVPFHRCFLETCLIGCVTAILATSRNYTIGKNLENKLRNYNNGPNKL